MLPAGDVVDLMPEARVRLGHETVFAAKACPARDLSAETVGYLSCHWRGSVGPWLWPSG
jgi:hypothetical protein